jgi:dihydroorotase
MKLLIKNGRVIDPANHIDALQDILVENGRISAVGKDLKAKADRTIDAAQKIVMPGIIDMHVHLREPGREDKETIATGTLAALKGGVTSVLAMANTDPAIDSPENVALVKDIIKKTAHCNVFITAAITWGRLGKQLTPIAALKKAGALAISDDGNSVDDSKLLSEALKKAKENGILTLCHCEDKTLSSGGVVNRGFISTRMGLRGISNASEYTRVERDIELAAKAKAPVHITHVSCKESVEIIARARKKGIKVTADTAPHYFALSEEEVLGFDPNMKMNPPLRSKEDMEAIKQGLKNGVIDAIASDHAPHTENEKDIEFERAEFGKIGLESSLAVSITELIKTKVLTWPQLVEKLAVRPAQILQIDKGSLAKGKDADIIVVSPDREWVLKKEEIVSKSKNSPFLGRHLTGRVEYTICCGKIVYQAKD